MKKIAVFIIIFLFAVSAFAQVQMNEAKYVKWAKGVKLPVGYQYDDVETSESEYTASYYKQSGKGMSSITVKVDAPEKFEMYKNDKTITDVKLTTYKGKKAIYYRYKTMNLSSVIVDMPEIKGKLTLAFSPAFSAADMEKVLNGIAIDQLR